MRTRSSLGGRGEGSARLFEGCTPGHSPRTGGETEVDSVRICYSTGDFEGDIDEPMVDDTDRVGSDVLIYCSGDWAAALCDRQSRRTVGKSVGIA